MSVFQGRWMDCRRARENFWGGMQRFRVSFVVVLMQLFRSVKLLSLHILKGDIGLCANYRYLKQPDFLRYVIWRKTDFKFFFFFFFKAHRSWSFRGVMSQFEWDSEHSRTGLQRSGGRRWCHTRGVGSQWGLSSEWVTVRHGPRGVLTLQGEKEGKQTDTSA